MKNEVKYEWSFELTEDGDIIDSAFADKLKDLNIQYGVGGDICLVRNEGDEINGLGDRFWAYVKNGKLPERFSDANGHEINILVPKKFHRELENNIHL